MDCTKRATIERETERERCVEGNEDEDEDQVKRMKEEEEEEEGRMGKERKAGARLNCLVDGV